LTIATSEIGTSGLVAARLTEPEGYSRWFRGCSVPDADAFQGENEAAAQAQSLATQKTTVADVGVGIGPIVVPDDSTPERPYGVVDVAINVRGQATCRRFSVNGDRARVREWAADAALAQVRLRILEQD
jgi:nicotinamide mononucleotide (NMN) deamidase PncC